MATKITAEVAQEILSRFQQGTTSLAEERARYGIRNNATIRDALRKLVGAEAYRALILAGKKSRAPAA